MKTVLNIFAFLMLVNLSQSILKPQNKVKTSNSTDFGVLTDDQREELDL